MANVDRPHGLRPVGTLSGASWNGQYRKFYTDTNAFLGDIVIQDAVAVAAKGPERRRRRHSASAACDRL